MLKFISAKPNMINGIIYFCIGTLLLLFTIPLIVYDSSIGWWLMQSIPLLLILPQMRSNKRRPLQWLGFLVLFYFAAAVLQVFSSLILQRWLGSLTIISSWILFMIIIAKLRSTNSQQEQLNDQ